jgi:hypothetical protein
VTRREILAGILLAPFARLLPSRTIVTPWESFGPTDDFRFEKDIIYIGGELAHERALLMGVEGSKIIYIRRDVGG